MNNTFQTPILFVIFNRPDTTRRVFEKIRLIRPAQLFVAGDGPRENRVGEMEKCEAARSVIKQIDWPCEVKTLFQKKNLGCKIGVSTAINWFFQNVDEGIILEDDCLPGTDFFTFSSEMLAKYKYDDNVMHINGTNFQFGNLRGEASYYFSRCVHIWGWATWKRAWNKYDIEMRDIKEYAKTGKIFQLFKDEKVAKFWLHHFNHILEKKIDTWDAQWVYAVIKSNASAITPNTNLVENIGLGDGTHTGRQIRTDLVQKSGQIQKITHPKDTSINQDADDYLTKKIYMKSPLQKIIDKISFLG